MSKHTMSVLNAYESCLENPEVMKAALKYYLTRFPQYAGESIGKDAKNIKLTLNIDIGSYEYDWRVGTELTATRPQWDNIVRLMASDEKISAIKALRSYTGAGLKEAKDMAEFVGAHHSRVLG